MRSCAVVCLLAALLTCHPLDVTASPITPGTIFLDPDIATAADPTTFTGLTYAGTGNRLMFDRRVDAFVVYHAFLFDVTFADGLTTEIQVNPEFATVAAAQLAAEKYGDAIGQLPTALRDRVDSVWIHQGTEPFGGGNNNILIHTGQAALYEADGILEETLIHEAAHSSLDPLHAAAGGWLAAQIADGDFISEYARDNPTREDIAESFLVWLAVRHRLDRIDPSLAAAIVAQIPNRLAYFDAQNFDMTPVAVPEPGTLILLLSGGAWLAEARRQRRASHQCTRSRVLRVFGSSRNSASARS